MPENRICSTCGAHIPASAPASLCVACLLGLAEMPVDDVDAEVPPDIANPGSPPTPTGTGADIADYELIQEIGNGGMGSVHKARQISLNRFVALKAIKPGMDSVSILARFEAERQALALMDHPHIARVFDAGRTPLGRPFFVMELVEGIPITRFCDENRLTVRQRLELFIPVCQAIQHAHQKGIIHRDIKPGNVLVTLHDGRPWPKVIDFGIAKAIGPRLTEETVVTQLGSVIGTLEYMAPEQTGLNHLDIDTRADIYALGVLLYELLTGTTPLDRQKFKQATLDQVLHCIREQEPPKPSTRLNENRELLETACRHRGLESVRLPRLLQGDVDWIVMKALEKDRDRRYETADAMARDILRHLHDEPVLAGPPTTRYRVQKFVRKHRRAVAVIVGFVALLSAAALISTVLAIRASHERTLAQIARGSAQLNERKALESEADTEAFAQFLVNDVLKVARPKGLDGGLGIDVSVAQALEAAEPGLERQFKGRPKAEARVLHSLGITWQHLGRLDRAEQYLLRAAKLRESALGANAEETLDSRDALGLVLKDLGRTKEAIVMHESLLASARTNFGSDHSITLTVMNNLALDYDAAGRTVDGIQLLELALKTWESTRSAASSTTLGMLDNLAVLDCKAGRLTNALALAEKSVRLHRSSLGPENASTAMAINSLALVYSELGREDEALPLAEEALRMTKAQRGTNNSATLVMMNNVATHYERAGKREDAVRLHRETLEATRAALGPEHPDTLLSMNNLAVALRDSRHPDEGQALTEEALKLARRTLGADHPHTLIIMGSLGVMYRESGQATNAVPLLEESFKGLALKRGDNHLSTAKAARDLALAYQDSNRPAEALPLLELAYKIRKVNLRPTDLHLLQSAEELAGAYQKTNRWADALPLFEERLAGHRARASSDPHKTPRLLNNVAVAYQKNGRLAEAVPLFEEALSQYRTNGGLDQTEALHCLNGTALAYDDAGRYAAALPLFEEAFQTNRTLFGSDDPKTLAAMNLLGRAHYRLTHLADAIRVWEETLERRKRVLRPDHRDSLVTSHSLARAYSAAGRQSEAISLWEEALRLGRVVLTPGDPQRTLVLEDLANAYLTANRPADAESLWRELLAIQRKTQRPDSTTLAVTLLSLGHCLLRQDKPAEAGPFLKECAAIRKQRIPDHWSTFEAMALHGTALLHQKQYAEAEPLLTVAGEGLDQRREKIPAKLRAATLGQTAESLIRLYTERNQPQQAEHWRTQLNVPPVTSKPTPANTGKP